jgi:hypothetical protein
LSPYVLLKGAFKSLEYLVRKYHIHRHQIEPLLLCVLPFHTSPLFVRVVQVTRVKGTDWEWLGAVGSSGLPLERRALVNRIMADNGLLRRLHEAVMVAIQGGVPAKTKVALAIAAAVESLEASSVVSESLLGVMVPMILDGLQSDREALRSGQRAAPGEFLAGALLLLGQVASRVRLAADTAASLAVQVARSTLPGSKGEAVIHQAHVELGLLSLVHLAETQSIKVLPEKVFERVAGLPGLADILLSLSARCRISALLSPLLAQLVEAVAGLPATASAAAAAAAKKQADPGLAVLHSLCIRAPVEPLVPTVVRDALRCHFDKDPKAKPHPALVKILRALEQRFPSGVEQGVRAYFKSVSGKPPAGAYDLLASAFIDPRLQAASASCETTVALSLVHPDPSFRALGLGRIHEILKSSGGGGGGGGKQAAEDEDAEKETAARRRAAEVLIGESLVDRLMDDSDVVFSKLIEVLGSPEARRVVDKDAVLARLAVVLDPMLAGARSEAIRKAALGYLLGGYLKAFPDAWRGVAAIALDHVLTVDGIFEALSKDIGSQAHVLGVKLAKKPSSSSSGGVSALVERNALIIEAMAARVVEDPEANAPFFVSLLRGGDEETGEKEKAGTLSPGHVRGRTLFATLVLCAALEAAADEALFSKVIAKSLWALVSPLLAASVAAAGGNERASAAVAPLAAEPSASVGQLLRKHILPALPGAAGPDDGGGDRSGTLGFPVVWLAVSSLARFAPVPEGAKTPSDPGFRALWYPLATALLARLAPFVAPMRSLLSRVASKGSFTAFAWISLVWTAEPHDGAQAPLQPSRDLVVAQALHVARSLLAGTLQKPQKPAGARGGSSQPLLDLSLTLPAALAPLRWESDAVRAAAAACVAEHSRLGAQSGPLSRVLEAVALAQEEVASSVQLARARLGEAVDGAAQAGEARALLCAVVDGAVALGSPRAAAELAELFSAVSCHDFVHASAAVVGKVLDRKEAADPAELRFAQALLAHFSDPCPAGSWSSDHFDLFLRVLQAPAASLKVAALTGFDARSFASFTADQQTALVQHLLWRLEADEAATANLVRGILRKVPITVPTLVACLTALDAECAGSGSGSGGKDEALPRGKAAKRAPAATPGGKMDTTAWISRLVIIAEALLAVVGVGEGASANLGPLFEPLFGLLARLRAAYDPEALDHKTVDYAMQLLFQLMVSAIDTFPAKAAEQQQQQQQQQQQPAKKKAPALSASAKRAAAAAAAAAETPSFPFDLEALIACVTGSESAETQTHALLALASLARCYPSFVLTRLTPVFTRIGHSLSVDSSFSFHAVHETIRSVLPAIAQSSGGGGPDLHDILEVFVTALPDIPAHRRGPLFALLMSTLGNAFFGEVVCRALAAEAAEGPSSAAAFDVLPFLHELALSMTAREQCASFVGVTDAALAAAAPAPGPGLDRCEEWARALVEDLRAVPGRGAAYAAAALSFVSSHLSGQAFLDAVVVLPPEDQAALVPLVTSTTNACLELLETVSASSGEDQASRAVRTAAQGLLSNANAFLPTEGFVVAALSLLDNSDHQIRARALELLHSRLRDRKMTRSRYLSLFEPVIRAAGALVSRKPSPKASSLDQEALKKNRLLALQCLQAYANRAAENQPELAMSVLPTLLEGLEDADKDLTVASSAAIAVGAVVAAVGARAIERVNEFFPLLVARLADAVSLSRKLARGRLDPVGKSSIGGGDDASDHDGGDGDEDGDGEGEGEGAASAATASTVLLCLLDALTEVARVLAAFAGPYLPDLLGTLFSRPVVQSASPDVRRAAATVVDLIAAGASARIVLPAIPRAYKTAREEGDESLVQLFRFLGTVCGSVDTETIGEFKKPLFKLFIGVADFRRLYPDSGYDVPRVEEAIINAFVSFSLKLSEKSFQPYFLKVLEWSTVPLPRVAATGDPGDDDNNAVSTARVIFFNKLQLALVKKFKAIFVPFFSFTLDASVGYLNLVGDMFGVKAAEEEARRLAAEEAQHPAAGAGSSSSKKRKLRDRSAHDLATRCAAQDAFIRDVLDTLNLCFTYASAEFMEHGMRWEKVLGALVSLFEFDETRDQAIASSEAPAKRAEDVYRTRITDHVTPCIVQLAICLPNESLWKPLNHQVLMHTRSEKPVVRFAACRTIHALFERVGEAYLILLPETLPFIAELLEDDVFEVETLARALVKKIEELSGESLQELLKS